MTVTDMHAVLRLDPRPGHGPGTPDSLDRPPGNPAVAQQWVARARAAQPAWAASALRARLRCLRRFRAELALHADDVVACVRRRPAAETLAAEILPLLEACRFIERDARKVLATRRPRPRGIGAPGRVRVTVEREPLGVVLIIGPGNYGLMLVAVQALQALAAGNAVIIKPAPGAQGALMQFASLLVRSGVPGDLIRVVDESQDSAKALLDSAIDHVVFTGSNRAGRDVLMRAQTGLKPVALELSGWDPCIVLDDADPDYVAAALVFALRFNRGQTCVAPRRVFVSAAMRPALQQRLRERLAARREVSFEAGTASLAAQLISHAVARGATLLAGRLVTANAQSPVSGPVVLAGVTEDMPVWSTEVFGPIVMIAEYAEVDDAITAANRSDYALGASVFGSQRRASMVARRLRAGLVSVNDVILPLADAQVPLAPRGASGFGVTRGAEGMLAMTRPKAYTRPRTARAQRWAYELAPPAPLLAAYARLIHGAGLASRLRALGDFLRAAWRLVRRRDSDHTRQGVTGS